MLGSLLLSGCATPAKREAMVPTNISLNNGFDHSIAVHVTGGQETNPLWTSEVSNANFKAALEDAIRQSKLFSAVIQTDKTDYRLDVRLIELKQPIWALI